MPRFQKGLSGNPAGKPKGAKDKRTELRALLQPHAAELVQKAISLALEGNVHALRLCLERTISPVREERIHIQLPDISSIEDCRKAQAAVLASLASGELLPGEAQAVSGLIDNHLKALAEAEVSRRLAAVEEQLGIREGVRK